MTITINVDARDVPDGATVADLLTTGGVNPQLVAVEVNLEILRRDQYAGAVLRAGDTVEIVQMVGGGAW